MSNETDPSLKPPPPSEDANGAIVEGGAVDAVSGAPTHAFPGPGVVARVPTQPVHHLDQLSIIHHQFVDQTSIHDHRTINNYNGIGKKELKDLKDEIKNDLNDEFRVLLENIDATLEAELVSLEAKLAELEAKFEAKLAKQDAKFEAKLDAFKDEIFRAFRMNYPASASEANIDVQEAAVEESRGETPEADEWLRRFLGSKFNESEMMVLTRAALDGILPFKNKRNGQPCSLCASIIKETFEPGDSMSHAFRCSKHKGKDTH